MGRHDADQEKRLDTMLGFSILVEPGDYSSELILRDGVFEIPETDLVTRLVGSGDVCIDGGCHLGYYSCLLAKLTGPTGRVYAFDANPWCCQRTSENLALNRMNWAEVVQAALGNEHGTTPFHIAPHDQTGLSSLGPIERPRNIISAPWLRLEDFLNERGVQRVRLLKLDVEGAEELVLLGLGRALVEHHIDLVLLECYDERLQLLNCSTEDVTQVLEDAGYAAWEYGRQNPFGWSRANKVHSRGDCNYLFASPLVTEPIPSISLANALRLANEQRNRQQEQAMALRAKIDALEQLKSDLKLLKDTVEKNERESLRLRKEKEQLELLIRTMENSKGWRLLNKWRKMRDAVLSASRRNR